MSLHIAMTLLPALVDAAALTVAMTTQCEIKLKEQLGPEEKTLLEDLLKTQQDMDGVTAEENFILGFRLGVQLMAECLAGGEDD